jgi:hypothetical protein
MHHEPLVSDHLTRTELRGLAEDERSRVAALDKLRAHEHALRARTRLQAVAPLVQAHDPHAFRPPVVEPFSPRRQPDAQVAPGAEDNTGFLEGGIC